MQVLINDYPVDFELDQERSVSDIISSVSEWSRERDLVFYELYINNDLVSLDRVPDVKIDDINVINCIVHSKADIVFSSVDEAVRYCDRVSFFVKQVVDSGEWGRNEADDLVTGTAWLLEVLEKVLHLLGLSEGGLKYRDRDVMDHVAAIEKFIDTLRGISDPAAAREFLTARTELFADIKHIFRMLLQSDVMRTLIVQSIDSPDVLIAALVKTGEDLDGELENIRAAAIAYQTGRDAEGSERLKAFVDFIYRYTRTCYQVAPVFKIEPGRIVVGGVSLEQKNRELRDLLHEIIAIMENNDIISLSDILEYEVIPALSNLGEYIDLLLKGISKD